MKKKYDKGDLGTALVVVLPIWFLSPTDSKDVAVWPMIPTTHQTVSQHSKASYIDPAGPDYRNCA